MSKLLLLNLLMGAGLAYAAVREYRQGARTFRVLAAVSSLSLLVSLGLASQLQD
ncbi:hypothetical protein [Janthinobacterium sp. SUN120]|uniref:hypothetical protein n=1 Tax=Janthinobacterium sp. SUN120 TaxID=3004099 RepID=UPI0025B271C3|nr:hypothetical protein [Janthinobacterium sp. SUN120]MDN2717569.1 hypothetical protein [Janthinobacterium sp. SUN120]